VVVARRAFTLVAGLLRRLRGGFPAASSLLKREWGQRTRPARHLHCRCCRTPGTSPWGPSHLPLPHPTVSLHSLLPTLRPRFMHFWHAKGLCFLWEAAAPSCTYTPLHHHAAQLTGPPLSPHLTPLSHHPTPWHVHSSLRRREALLCMSRAQPHRHPPVVPPLARRIRRPSKPNVMGPACRAGESRRRASTYHAPPSLPSQGPWRAHRRSGSGFRRLRQRAESGDAPGCDVRHTRPHGVSPCARCCLAASLGSAPFKRRDDPRLWLTTTRRVQCVEGRRPLPPQPSTPWASAPQGWKGKGMHLMV
jgi:hypothetical protein